MATNPKIDYSAAYKDPRWQQKRLEIMGRDKFRCLDCEAEDNRTLNVHHLYYVSGREPWNYPDWSLRTVCDECHKIDHEIIKDEQMPWERCGETFCAKQLPYRFWDAHFFARESMREGISFDDISNAFANAVNALRVERGLEPIILEF